MTHCRRVGNRRNFAYFPSGTESMGEIGDPKRLTRVLLTKFGCDRSIVVDCRSRNDRQTDRQTEWNDNKAHSLQTWCNRQTDRHNMIPDNWLHYFTYNISQTNWSIVIHFSLAAFLIYWHRISKFPILRDFTTIEGTFKYHMQTGMLQCAPVNRDWFYLSGVGSPR